MMYLCSDCLRELPLDAFRHTNGRRKERFCKACKYQRYKGYVKSDAPRPGRYQFEYVPGHPTLHGRVLARRAVEMDLAAGYMVPGTILLDGYGRRFEVVGTDANLDYTRDEFPAESLRLCTERTEDD